MSQYVLLRVLAVIPTLLGLTLLTFVATRLIPGDPIETQAGQESLDPARHAELMHEYGFDRPVLVQYVYYLRRLAYGDLGTSMATAKPVISEFGALFPATVELAFCAIAFAILVGVPAGIIAAVRRNSIYDHGVMGLALCGYSIPTFWWGLLLILVFSNTLHWTPVSGRIAVQYYVQAKTHFLVLDAWNSGVRGAFASAVSHLVLPAIVLGTHALAIIARMTRSAMLEVLGQDYVRTARAKGLSPYRIIGLHALRNALIPVVTVIGLEIGHVLTGAIVTETIFSWPGVGKWMIDGLARRDYPVLQGGALLLGLTVISVNLIVDLLYGIINPRVRHA